MKDANVELSKFEKVLFPIVLLLIAVMVVYCIAKHVPSGVDPF